jgi:hypothetical protein
MVNLNWNKVLGNRRRQSQQSRMELGLGVSFGFQPDEQQGRSGSQGAKNDAFLGNRSE